MSNGYSGEFGETLNKPGGQALSKVCTMDAMTLKNKLGKVTVLDLRSAMDRMNDSRELDGSVRVSCTDLSWMGGLPKTDEYVLVCGGVACGKCEELAQRMVAAGFVRINMLCATMDEMARIGLPVQTA